MSLYYCTSRYNQTELIDLQLMIELKPKFKNTFENLKRFHHYNSAKTIYNEKWLSVRTILTIVECLEVPMSTYFTLKLYL